MTADVIRGKKGDIETKIENAYTRERERGRGRQGGREMMERREGEKE